MQTTSELIEALGGTVFVASALDVAPTTVSSWKAAGSIPRWRMAGIRALADEKGVFIPDCLAARPASKCGAAA